MWYGNMFQIPTIVLVLLAGHATSKVIIPTAQNNPMMKLIGTADGKAFFGESMYNGTARTWNEAAEHCGTYGMSLGEIVTENQFKLINSTSDPALRTGSGFWTGARDSHLYSQFMWQQAEVDASDSFMTWQVHAYLNKPLTCAYFLLPLEGSGRMEIANCETKTGVLCQT